VPDTATLSASPLPLYGLTLLVIGLTLFALRRTTER
jgi:hypothetical protein